jgi:hypothetical protein
MVFDFRTHVNAAVYGIARSDHAVYADGNTGRPRSFSMVRCARRLKENRVKWRWPDGLHSKCRVSWNEMSTDQKFQGAMLCRP